MTTEAAPITWWQDDPQRLEDERAAMGKAAPELRWIDDGPGGWLGEVPLWPYNRPEPAGLTRLVDGNRLLVLVLYRPAHPMVPPAVVPNVQLPVHALGLTDWHLLPNGALCLFRGTAWWDPVTLTAALIPKISGWYIEYHLMLRDCLERMPDRGIDRDPTLDALIGSCSEPVR